MRRWRGGRGSGGRAKGSGVIEGKRKRTEDGHRKMERERERASKKWNKLPLTLYGHRHNI